VKSNGMRVLLTAALMSGMAGWLHAADGVLIVQRITTGTNTTTSQVQLEKNRMRAEIIDPSGRQVVIFDGVKQVMDIVNPDKKTYIEMTKADVDRMAAQLEGAMSQMQQMMASLPPEQRAQAEAMMRGRGGRAMPGAPVKKEYKKVGTDRVGKWTCDKYDALQNGQKTGEICTVEPAVLGFSAADFEVSRQMGEFFKKLVPQAADQMFTVGRAEEQGFSGIPVRQVSQQSTSEITEVSRQSFPDSLFVVPAGFQKTDMMGGRGRY